MSRWRSRANAGSTGYRSSHHIMPNASNVILFDKENLALSWSFRISPNSPNVFIRQEHAPWAQSYILWHYLCHRQNLSIVIVLVEKQPTRIDICDIVNFNFNFKHIHFNSKYKTWVKGHEYNLTNASKLRLEYSISTKKTLTENSDVTTHSSDSRCKNICNQYN